MKLRGQKSLKIDSFDLTKKKAFLLKIDVYISIL